MVSSVLRFLRLHVESGLSGGPLAKHIGGNAGKNRLLVLLPRIHKLPDVVHSSPHRRSQQQHHVQLGFLN